MSRAKKKHVCSCGEEFNHGIGLRKHQRQTGHKGSSIVDDEGGGADEGGAGAAPPPPAPAPAREVPPARAPEPPPPAPPTPPPAPVHEPPVRAAAAPPPSTVPDEDEDEEPAQTVAVNRGNRYVAPPPAQEAWEPEYLEGPSRFQHNRQKLSLIGRGLRVLLSYRARSAGHQLKRSARSGADIFAEALKIAVALLLFMAIPAGLFYWWWKGRDAVQPPLQVPNTFTFEGGALAARSEALKYLDDLGKKRWSDAYARLSSGWRQEISLASFEEAFSGIGDIRWAVNDQKLLPGGQADVSLILAFVEDGRAKKFQGRFRLAQEGQAWKVDRVELSSPPAR